ncbi:hypothetical protein A9Q99_04280 [Gammaproteobacteria bacterium 45_16_T64]|nr:hypothetical protein A9Q99_04280 [Gammaproteobacteria bacterium 45_16_T64]
MTVFELMSKLGAAGIKLWLEDGQLKFKAPKGALTKELKGHLVAKKDDVIEFLSATRVGDDAAEETIPKADRSKLLPLSYSQQRMWFIEQLMPANSTFHIPAVLVLKGVLDKEALRKSFELLVARHESLRTVFETKGEEAIQVINEVSDFRLPYTDLTDVPVGDRDAQAKAIAENDIRTGFSLTNGPLIRAQVLKLDDNRHGLIVVMHHIVSDGWSMEIFVKEMALLYAATRKGEVSPLPELNIQYADFAQWQRNWLTGDLLDAQLGYWKKQLANAPEQLVLPYDRARPALKTNNGSNLDFGLSGELLGALRKVARELDVTLYVLLLAAYKVVLAKWSGQPDLCVGMPVAGRNEGQVQSLIGFFINTLVVRTHQEDNPSLKQFIAQVREQVLGAQAHQDVPLEAIVETLNIPRNLSFSPLYQVAFSLTSGTEQAQTKAVGGLEIEPFDVDLVAARQDITMMLVDKGEELSGMIEYNVDLFDSSTIQHFSEHYRQVLSQIANNIDKSIASVELISQAALHKMLGDTDGIEGVFPLTQMQRDFVLDSVRDSGTVRNTVGYRVELPFSVDANKWEAAVNKVAAEQPSHRVRFVESMVPWLEPIYQTVLKECKISVEYVDLANVGIDTENDQAILDWLTETALVPWDVLGGMLHKHWLVKVADNRYFALSAWHHALTDGVSEFVRVKQTVAAYFGNDTAPQTTALFGQRIQDRRLISDTSQMHQFWQSQLQNVETLGYRSKNPGELNVNRIVLEGDKNAAITEWCEKNEVSFVNLLRTLFALSVRNCYHQADDVALIEAVAARNENERESIGCYFQFTPALFLGSDCDSTGSIVDLLNSHRAWRKQLNNNVHLSFSARGRLLSPEGLEFQFNFRTPEASQGFEVEGQRCYLQAIQPDNPGMVKLLVSPGEESVELRLSYYDKEFDGFDLCQRIVSVIDQIVAGEDQLQAFNWLTVEEKQNQLVQWQGDAYPIEDHTVLDLIRTQVTATPDAIAVVCGEASLSYRSLDQRSNQVARLLHSKGVKEGGRVAICVDRSIEIPVFILAVLKLGAAYVPMDPAYPAERLSFIAKDSGASLLLTEPGVLDKFDDPSVLQDQIPVVLRADAIEASGVLDSSPLAHRVTADKSIYIIYTSGSTGQPKGAELRHSGEVNLLQWYGETLGLSANDRVLLTSAIGFDLTQKNIFAAFTVGGTLVIPETEEYDPEVIASLIEKEKVTIVNCAPSAFYPVAALTQHSGYPFPSLRHLVLGGEPIQIDLLNDWLASKQCVCALTNSYGPTECTDVVASHQITNSELQANISSFTELPIGVAVNNSQLYVTNRRGGLVPTGVAGELCIAGVGVGNGYLNQPELSQQVFVDNPYGDGKWYHTGDLVRYNAEGQLVYVGRKDFQVKLRGLRIEPGEIDTLIQAEDGVGDSLTLVRDDILVSYIVTTKTVDITILKATLKSQLPDFMVPSVLTELPAWPLTPNGKIDRKALPDPDIRRVDGDFIAPRNDSEELIAGIWCQVLGTSQVSINADFFSIGGHSLLATQVVARIRQGFGIELSVRALFENPTIELLVSVIEVAAASGHIITAPPIKALDAPNREVLSFAQHRLWFIDQLNQGSSEYNMPTAMRLKGPLQSAVLDSVFAEIVRRHEVLRTNFGADDGEPTLIVHESTPWKTNIVDLSHVGDLQREDEIRTHVDQDANSPFTMADDRLITSKLLRLADDDHVLLLNMHHIISDGWSIGVLVQEIKALYEAFIVGKPSPLPELEIQYSDYSVWQRNWLQGKALENLQKYWLETLGDAPDVLRIPTDRPRPKVQTFNGAHFPLELGQGLTGKLNAFCEQQEFTPFMVLMGAYQILLSRYCNQNDICIGIPIAGRNRSEIEGLIGFFINGLVIRTKLDGNPSIVDYLERVKEASLGAYSHQDMPADLLADAMKLDRSAEHAPGAQVGFALQNTPQEAIGTRVADIELTPIVREHKTAKYEFSLILQENDSNLGGVVEFNTDLFDASTIEKMMTHYSRILEQMIEKPNAYLDNLKVVSEGELYGLLDVDASLYELKPLSPMQRDMYLDTLMEPDSLKNSMGYHTIVTGRFEIGQWEEAAQGIVDAQPLMRCGLIGCDVPYADVAYHQIEKQRTISIDYVDISDQTTSDDAAGDIAQNFIWQPYDITQNILTEYRVYKLDNDRHLLVFRMNHLIADGVSMVLHGMQNIQGMEAIANGKMPPTVPPLFDQHVEKNNTTVDSPEVLAYWKEKGQTLEALDFAIPPQAFNPDETPQRVEKRLRVSDEHWEAVKSYCADLKIHPSLYFKAIYILLINTYCRGESDFSISEVLSGRKGFHKMTFGNYFEVMPMVIPQDLFIDGRDVKDLFDHIKGYKKTVKNVSSISLLAQRQLLPQGRFSFMFNYYNFIPQVVLFGEKLTVKGYPQVQDGPIQFVAHDQDGYMDLVLIYMSNRFADLRFLERFEQISKQIVSGNESVKQLEYILPDEKDKQLSHWLGERVPQADVNSVVDLIEQQTEKTPDAIAVRYGDESVSYRQLSERSNQLAHYLLSHGVSKGDRIALCLDRSIDMMVSVLGTLKVSAAYVPMDSNYPSERLAYMLSDSDAKLLVTQSCIVQRLQDDECDLSKRPLFVLDDEACVRQLDSQSTITPDSLPSPDDLIYIIYTSGSTGVPKGAGVYHRGELNLLSWYVDELAISANDRFMLTSAFGFDLTQKNLFAALTQGGQLVIPKMDHYDVDVLSSTIAEQQVTVVNCAPSAFYPLLEDTAQQGYPYPSLRYLVLGGEPIRLATMDDWLSLDSVNCAVINSYGPTECTDVVACHIVDSQDRTADTTPIGRPVPNTDIYVADANGKLLPEGIVGELCVAGEGLGQGYVGKPDLTAKVFTDNPHADGKWYRTGDLVRYWPNGDLEYVGRKDFQVKLRGLRIELGEIESALSKQDEVHSSLTLVVDDQLISYVLVDGDFNESQCRNGLRNYLPEYMIPALVIALDEWPLTPNGKIDRKALPSPDEQPEVEYVAPRNDTEEKLARIWSEVLSVDQVGVYDNFFDLGGHSLLAARVVSKFRKEFDIDVPLRSLFELHTIAEIAEYMDTMMWAAQNAKGDTSDSAEDENRDEGFL